MYSSVNCWFAESVAIGSTFTLLALRAGTVEAIRTVCTSLELLRRPTSGGLLGGASFRLRFRLPFRFRVHFRFNFCGRLRFLLHVHRAFKRPISTCSLTQRHCLHPSLPGSGRQSTCSR